jgi:hypothetical protein
MRARDSAPNTPSGGGACHRCGTSAARSCNEPRSLQRMEDVEKHEHQTGLHHERAQHDTSSGGMMDETKRSSSRNSASCPCFQSHHRTTINAPWDDGGATGHGVPSSRGSRCVGILDVWGRIQKETRTWRCMPTPSGRPSVAQTASLTRHGRDQSFSDGLGRGSFVEIDGAR